MKYLFIVLFLAACSSGSKKTEDVPTDAEVLSPEIQKEFNWIENADFKDVEAVPYDAKNDQYTGSFNDEDALAKESVARLPPPQIERVADSDDVITRLAGLCYGKKFNDAFKVIEKVHRQYKKHPTFWNQVGNCHFEKRDLRSAIVFYNKARDLDKKFAPPLNNLGVIYQMRGSMQKAALAYKEASKLNALSLTPIFNLAQLQLQGGQVESAIYAFQALVKQNNEDTDALAGFATALLIRGDFEQASKVYARIPNDKLKTVTYGANYALALKLSGNGSKAQEVITSLSSTPEQDQIAYYNQVKAFVFQGGQQ